MRHVADQTRTVGTQTAPDWRAALARCFLDDRPLTLEQIGQVLAKDPARPLSPVRVREILKKGYKVRGKNRYIRPTVTSFGTYIGVRPSDLAVFIDELSGAVSGTRTSAASQSVPRMFARRQHAAGEPCLSLPADGGRDRSAINGMDAVGHRPRERSVAVSRSPRPAGRGEHF